MHTTIELLDLAKAAHNVSDYKLAQLLDVVPSAVKNYRAGRSHPDQAVCIRLAGLVSMDPDLVFCSVQADRASNETFKAQWARIADRLKAAASVVACALLSVAFSGSPDAHAQGRQPVSSEAPANFLASTVYTS